MDPHGTISLLLIGQIINPLVLLLRISHFLESHFQVYEWALKYVNK